MNYSVLQKKYNTLCEYIYEKQITNSLDILSTLVNESQNGDYIRQFENYKDTFTNILKYSFEQLEDDPEREKIYTHLIISILELADKTTEYIISNQKLLSSFQLKNRIANAPSLSDNEINEIIKVLTFQDEIENLKSSKKDESKQKPANRKEVISQLFTLFWLKDIYKEAEYKLLTKIIKNNAIPWHDKGVFVSAITLSMLRYFDIAKFNMLFTFYDANENQVWQRALVGILIGLCHYDRRLILYPELVKTISKYSKQKTFLTHIENTIIRLLKAKETEKITKKFKEEIVPEMMKFKPKLENKLDLENILSDKYSEDKNPDWETFFQDSPDLFNKLEEFSRLQLEGVDVFMGTFSMLKQFDFFNEISHWFLPFYKENEIVQSALENLGKDFDSQKFTEGLEQTAFLCNSDKYSFCLNVNVMPSEQKSLMVEMFNMEIKAMNEVSKDDELLNQTAKDNFIFTQYIQDFYRFCKLYPNKNEFTDIFSGRSTYHKLYFLHHIFKEKNIVRNIAEFYFEKEYYDLAIEAFDMFLEEESNLELFQKIAYSYQMLQKYEDALEYYHKAEFFDKNKSWNYRKIAQCYRKLKVFDKAIEYYKLAEKLEPENLYTQTFLGHTYLDMKEYETALKYYFKVEYLAPENKKIHLPIAWCSFVSGKLDTAKKYIIKVIKKEPKKHDLLIAGHIYWCNNEKTKAIEYYSECIKKAEFDYKWFIKEFRDDLKYLQNYITNELDFSLMIDYINFFTKPKS